MGEDIQGTMIDGRVVFPCDGFCEYTSSWRLFICLDYNNFWERSTDVDD